MRTLFFATLLFAGLIGSMNAVASKNRLAAPQSVELGFEHGSKVKFKLSEGKILDLTVVVTHSALSVPQAVCAKLKNVHFETVVLVYGGHTEAISQDDWFLVRFSVGHESDRFMNLLPEVEIQFRDGKFYYASITRRQGDTWVSDAL
jgi:hypothetical protein